MAFTADGFDIRLESGVVEAHPLTHFDSLDKAIMALRPILAAWEAQARLEHARRQVRFEFMDARTIDRTTGRPFAGASSTESFGFGVAGAATTVANTTYPAAPIDFRTDAVLEAILERLGDLDSGRMTITTAANWVVTRAESEYGGGKGGSDLRRATAKALGLDYKILSELGRLASQNDPTLGRKAKGPAVPLTDSEKTWMRAAIVLIAQQVGTLNAGAALTPRTLGDLPAYP